MLNKSILLVEKDEDLREYLQDALKEEGYAVEVSISGVKAIKKLDKFIPDLILISAVLPEMESKDIINEIKEDFPGIPLIVTVAKEDVEKMKSIYKFGADDFVTKPISLESLLTRIEMRISGKSGTKGSTLKVGDLTLDTEKYLVKRNGKKVDLTPKEFILLKYLMKNKGKVLTRDLILNRVWNYPVEIDSRVVDVYMGYLRKKIDKGNKKELIHTIRGFGYTLRE